MENSENFANFESSATSEDTDNTKFNFEEELINTPTIPNEVYAKLPSFLNESCNVFDSNREKDVFLTGAITLLSGCFPSVYGIYQRREVYTSLFHLLIAPPASGKGTFSLAKFLGNKFHRTLVEASEKAMIDYKKELERIKNLGKEQEKKYPPHPVSKKLFIPGNISSASIIQNIRDNDGYGLIFETEADTLGNAIQQDWGGFSDILRKIFHHEAISSSRKTNAEYSEVLEPKLSVALSGTPSQLLGLIKSVEDGLFSRFIFYCFKVKSVWKNLSPHDDINLNEYFNNLSEQLFEIIEYYKNRKILFKLTESQINVMNKKFDEYVKTNTTFVHEDTATLVFRLGLIFYRICMILSCLRKFEEKSEEETIYCNDLDFEIALKLIDVYTAHSIFAFKYLSSKQGSKKSIDKKVQLFFDALPDEFERKEAIGIGVQLDISDRTIDNYLKKFEGDLVEKLGYGKYKKMI